MKGKAPLVLMEQMVMVLVFAMAAALCLQSFALAHRISGETDARDRAVVVAQNAAETLKSTEADMADALDRAARIMGGQTEQGLWYINYDENWNETRGTPVYSLEVQGIPAQSSGLQTARIRVISEESRGEWALVEFTAGWQGEGVPG